MQFLLAVLLAAKIVVPYVEHTEEDVRIVAEAAIRENESTGKNEDENEQVLIATMAVIANRMKSGEWGGSSAKEVIFAKGQYASPTRKGIGHTSVSDRILQLSEEVLTYGTNVPEYVIYQSMQSKLGTVWKCIDGEYFATSGGHYMEGKDIHIETNKHAYIKQCFDEFRKRFCKTIRQSIKKYCTF